MNDQNICFALDCDDDVVLFEKDTFKISRLKELMIREVRNKIIIQIHDSKQQYGGEGINTFLRTITIGEEILKFSYINLKLSEIVKFSNLMVKAGRKENSILKSVYHPMIINLIKLI